MYLYKCDTNSSKDCIDEKEFKDILDTNEAWFRIRLYNEQYDYTTGKTNIVS